jgi:dephospho-CoA kinase
MCDPEAIRGEHHGLLIGVTGGIASGKTTVANMLKALGIPLIDFDLLAREVVEPGKPAWRDIVAYFGERVLQKDGSLDRRVLSDIVFRDEEKRKKIEIFTHPRITEAFTAQLNEIKKNNPDTVIQAVVPLLIETNLQDRFHKILVVYVPAEVQVDRLAAREKITREEAARIIKAQLPIDKKVGYADFVIHNENSLQDTQNQVERLVKQLRTLQKKRRG